MTRTERMQWCKDRALGYLPGDINNAVTSFMSDASKPYGDQPPLVNWGSSTGATLSQLGMMALINRDVSGVRRWIEGFN